MKVKTKQKSTTMRKTLLIMAVALLLTQCRKPEVKFPTPTAAEGVTVSMTVTACPGGKTDISETGAITWNSGDKLYVGCGGKYVGYLMLEKGADTPTGWFSGKVTLTGIPEGDEQTFGFFYLGNAKDYSTELEKGTSTTVDVDFSSQNIYNNSGKLENASKHNVGYGSANGTVKDGVVTGINVTLVSKVALARFSFKKAADDEPYDGALTLSGTNIYKDMTVNFGGTFAGKTEGNISLTSGHAERYVMLVPAGTGSKTLNFVGGATGITTLENGIEANKFYGRESAIEVKVTPIEFTVGNDGSGNPIKVKFSPGNLYYNGADADHKMNQNLPSGWNFYEHQYDRYASGTSTVTNKMEISLFTWGYGEWSTVYNTTQSQKTFTDWGTITSLPDNAGGTTWRTLTIDEWSYLLNINGGSSGRTDANRFAKAMVKEVTGLLIFPDGYNDDVPVSGITGVATVNKINASYPSASIPDATWTSMERAGVVFLPTFGFRNGTALNLFGNNGYYTSSTLDGSGDVKRMHFTSSDVFIGQGGRDKGFSVRLVRSAS